LLDDNPVHGEGLERQRDVLAQLVGRYVDGAVRFRLGAAAPQAARARPARLTQDSARVERLAHLRGKDASLDAAVDALDLELLE
jgi:hypothetical protein